MGLARLLPRPNVRATANGAAPAETQVLALANQKGGVAKTTTTLNLGVALAEHGHRVLCVDRGDRARPDGIPLAARTRAAREHAPDGPREPQPARGDRRHPPDDVRQAA